MRGEGGLTVEGFEILCADNVVERIHRLLERLGTPQVVAGGESMARIDAHAHPRLVLHKSDNVPQILPRGPHDVAAARHVLQHRDDRLGGLVRLVELRGDPPNRRGLGVAPRGSRVEVVQPDAQLLAPREVVDEAVVCLLGLLRVGLRQVHQV